MKRLTPFFMLLCLGLVAAWGLTAWHPPKVSAYYAWNDDKGDDGHHHDGDEGCRDDDGDHHDGDHHDDGEHHDHGNDGHDHDGRGGRVGSFLVTVTNYATGGVAERAVITLHRDHTMSVISSNQGNSQLSSQLGAWKHGCSGTTGRTLQFSFGDGTINRMDYTFDGHQPKDAVSGTIVITNFPGGADPLGDGGTFVGHFEFTGTRIEAPPDKDQN